jgi:mRNA interferase RelE/StbE
MSAGSNRYRIVIAGAARRRLERLSRKDRDRIDAKILTLADNPRPHGVEKLTDADELYRVRVGDRRIIFTIDDSGGTVAVEDVRGRDDVYRKRSR